jgi:Na+-translocating ferredoxin:NAD+ oxidoreductase RnfG subunit
MSKLGIAALALLFGWCVSIPTGADAAPTFSHALSAAAAPSHIQLAQYGGGDDDDGPAPQNNSGGGYDGGGCGNCGAQHHHHGGGGFNINGAISIINGIVQGVSQAQRAKQQRDNEQRYYQQRNDQIKRNNAAAAAARRNADAARRANERAAQERAKERAAEERKHQQELDKEKAEKDEQIKELKEQVEQQKKKDGIENATREENEKYPDDDDNDDVHHDKVFNAVIDVHPTRQDMPDPSDLPNLQFGQTKLPACGYVNLPANRTLCTGSTDSGAWLRIVTVPKSGGGSTQACVQFNRQCEPRLVVNRPKPTPPAPPQPPRYIPEPAPVPPPTPVPPPVVCRDGSCAPTPCVGPTCDQERPPEDRRRCANPPCEPSYVPKPPQRNAVCTNPPCEPHYEPTPQPCTGPSCGERPAVNRACANPPCAPAYDNKPKPVVEEKTYPTVPTDKAQDTVQEEPKYQEPPVGTDKAKDVVQEEPKYQEPPVNTDKAKEVVQEEPKYQEPPVNTDKAAEVVQEEPKYQEPPTNTDKAQEVVQKEEEKKVTPPVPTGTAVTVVQNDEEKNVTPPTACTGPSCAEQQRRPVARLCADPPCEPHYDAKPTPEPCTGPSCGERPPVERACANPPCAPVPYTPPTKTDTAGEIDEAVSFDKPTCTTYSSFDPVCHLDSKGCTPDGDKSIADLMNNPDFRALLDNVAKAASFQHPMEAKLREGATGLMGAIPDVGTALGGVVKFLWKDPTNDELFKQLKAYVDTIVPDSITEERLKQQKYGLKDLSSDLKKYRAEGNAFQKGLDLKILVTKLGDLESAYLTDPDTPPEKALALVIAYGALRLTALQELVQRQEELFGKDKTSTTAVNDYNTAVETFQRTADAIKKKIVEKRLAMLGSDDKRVCTRWSRYRKGGCGHEYWINDGLCDWTSPHYQRDDKESRWKDLNTRKDQVSKAYNRDLDDLLKPITHWASLTPTAQSTDEHGRPLPPPQAQVDDATVDDATPVANKPSDQPPTKTDTANNVVEKKPGGQPQKTADTKPDNKGGELDEATTPCMYGAAVCDQLQQLQRQTEQKEQEREKKIAEEHPAQPAPAWCAGKMPYRDCIGADNNKKEMKKLADEEKWKKEHPDEWSMQHPGPTDSKGCTADGDKPIATLIKNPDYRALLDNIAEGASFQHPTEAKTREALTGLMGAIPDVGTALGGVVKFLWKDPTNDELFKQMKAYVDALVPDSITSERLKQQKYGLDGLTSDLKGYRAEGNPFQKGLDLKMLVTKLGDLESAYLTDPDTPPEKALALVIAYGALRLTALQELVQRQNEFFPGQTSTTAVDDYNTAVKTFADTAAALKQKIVDNRLNMFGIDKRDECFSSDDFRNCDHYYHAADRLCDWTSREHRSNEHGPDKELANRKEQVRKVYNRDLDELLKPITHWPSMTPTARTADDKGRPQAQLDDATADDAAPVATKPTKAGEADDVSQKKPNGKPQKTAKVDPDNKGGEIDEAQPADPDLRDCMRLISPMRYPNLNLSNWRADPAYQQCMAENKKKEEEKKKHDDEIARQKKKEEENKYALEHPGPTDGKGCTAHGDKPIATLIKNPDYRALLENASPSDATFHPPNNTARTVVTGGLSAIPAAATGGVPVGAMLGAVANYLWKDSTTNDLFKQMKAYVDAIVPDAISDERVNQQSYDVAGLQKLLERYRAEGNLYQKGNKLNNLVDRLIEIEPAYLNDPKTPPEKALALVIAYGALRLTALQEQVQRQKEFSPGNTSTIAVDDYNKAVDTFTKAAEQLKAKIIESRLAKIRPDSWEGEYWSPRFGGHGATYYHRATDDFCSWQGPNRETNEGAANNDVEQRKKEVREAYDRDLDELLKPITHWPSLTPVAQLADDRGRPAPVPEAQIDDATVDDAKPVATDKAMPSERSELMRAVPR